MSIKKSIQKFVSIGCAIGAKAVVCTGKAINVGVEAISAGCNVVSSECKGLLDNVRKNISKGKGEKDEASSN